MALIKCPMCEKMISPNAVSCPNCGEPMKNHKDTVSTKKNLILKQYDNKYGYVAESDQDNFIIKPIYDDATEFFEEIASVKVGNKWGAINLDGKMIIEPKFEYKLKFKDSKARVKIDGSWKYIDTKGEIIKSSYDSNINSQRKYQVIKIIDYDERIDKKNIIKCPNCKSDKVHKISGLSKAGSAIAFGILSIGKLSKTFQCDDCGYRW